MRRESALAQGCAIADGHGGQPVSEGSGGSGHIRPGVKGGMALCPLTAAVRQRWANHRSLQGGAGALFPLRVVDYFHPTR